MSFLEKYTFCCSFIIRTDVCVCSENYVAIPFNERGNIAIWRINKTVEEPTLLIGHHMPVSALSFSYHPISYYLCSCSSDNIILWNLLQNDGKPTKGRVLLSHMDQPFYCQFSSDNIKIAVSFPNEMKVFDLKENSWLVSVQGINLVQFIFNANNNNIFGIEENLLKNWDLKTNEVTTKESIATGFPSALCFHEKSEILVIGTTYGHLIVYNKKCNIIKTLQVWRILAQYFKLDPSEEGSDSFLIHSLEVINLENSSHSKDYLNDVTYLLIVTSTCLVLLNINNEEVVFFSNFNDTVQIKGSRMNIGLIRSSSIFCSSDKSMVYISLVPVMSDSLQLLKLLIKEIILCKDDFFSEHSSNSEKQGNAPTCKKPHLTFLNSNSRIDGKSLLVPKSQAVCKNKNLRKGANKLDLPVTFHTNIKSSGYGTLHKSPTLFYPQINRPRKSISHSSLPIQNVNITVPSKKSNIFENYEAPINFEKLELQSKLELFENPTISSLQLTVDGHYASCTSSEGLTDILEIGKQNMKIISTIHSHNGEVNAAKWSHSGKLLITAGNDKLVKVWDFEKKYPLLTIGNDQDNLKDSKKVKFIFEDPVEHVQFYYLDRFIVAASGNGVYLFDYTIDIAKSGIKSFINKSCLKLIRRIPLDMKRITTIAAMNQFFSNLLLCSGSSKCIDIIDMNIGKVVHQISDSSKRSPHLISLNEGSPYTTQESSMYDLFLTSSLFDGIKIWDLRSKKSVICYKEHKCRCLPCDAIFSPCGKYIVTGSEDKSIYIYDLRQLPSMCKLSNQQVDAFTSVAFSPKSQLFASSLNGIVCLYGAT